MLGKSFFGCFLRFLRVGKCTGEGKCTSFRVLKIFCCAKNNANKKFLKCANPYTEAHLYTWHRFLLILIGFEPVLSALKCWFGWFFGCIGVLYAFILRATGKFCFVNKLMRISKCTSKGACTLKHTYLHAKKEVIFLGIVMLMAGCTSSSGIVSSDWLLPAVTVTSTAPAGAAAKQLPVNDDSMEVTPYPIDDAHLAPVVCVVATGVQDGHLTVRAQPDYRSQPVGWLSEGDTVTATIEIVADDWLPVVWHGNTAYVRFLYLDCKE